MQRRRVELDKLQIAYRRAAPVRRCHPVPGSHIGIRRIPVQPPHPASGQQHAPRTDRQQSARGFIQSICAGRPPACHHQVDNRAETPELDIRDGRALLIQRPRDLTARRVAVRVQHPAPAVCRFAGEQQFRPLAVEFGAPLDQLLNPLRTLLHQHPHRIRATQPVARRDRVRLMQAHLVFVAQRHRHPALRIFRR